MLETRGATQPLQPFLLSESRLVAQMAGTKRKSPDSPPPGPGDSGDRWVCFIRHAQVGVQGRAVGRMTAKIVIIVTPAPAAPPPPPAPPPATPVTPPTSPTRPSWPQPWNDNPQSLNPDIGP